MVSSGKPLCLDERIIKELHEVSKKLYEGTTTNGRKIRISFGAGILDISIDYYGVVYWGDEHDDETLEQALFFAGFTFTDKGTMWPWEEVRIVGRD